MAMPNVQVNARALRHTWARETFSADANDRAFDLDFLSNTRSLPIS